MNIDSPPHYDQPGVYGRPSRVRYGVIAASTLMAILLYLDRFCIGIAEPFIRQDLGLSKQQMGIFMSAFFWPYALAQIPSGWLADRFGARKMMTIYILAWSFFTAMMGLANGFIMLVAMRAAYGLGQAGAYPTSSSIVSRWIPPLGRGGASSFISLGGRIGGAIAPVLTAILIVAFVSADRSPLLEPVTVLDSDSILEKLSKRNDKDQEAYLHVYNRSTAELQELVLSVSAENTGPTEPTQSRQLIATGFNRLLHDREFFSDRAFLRVKNMDRFATKCIKRLENNEQLSDADSRKFNRFLLESLFPIEIQRTYMKSWRPALWLYGGVGLLVAGFFWLVVRDRPHDHPRCNEAEVELITGELEPDTSKKIGSIPLGDIVSSPSLWFSSLSQIGVNIGWLFIGTWFPTYLMEQYQVPILERGAMVMVPFLVGFPGMLLGGFVTDRLVSLVGVRWARRLPWIISKSIAVVAFAACPLLDSPWMVTAMMATVAFCVDFGNPSSWAFTQDVGGRHVGSVLGFGNMWGNLGAAVSPILLIAISDNYSWNHMFFTCAGLFTVSTICSFFIDAATPVIREDK
ncbi:MAG: MFS transporter [Planctomycetota bacterium]|nr:MFS transporter [Planctomycetota bacterium]